ncbi:MAG TPA: hypothetical protein VFF27_13780 [Bacteroidia bacterium]|jgi:hypothetical protein|nr:hypothetical protein [Bacteroidia bacterium]
MILAASSSPFLSRRIVSLTDNYLFHDQKFKSGTIVFTIKADAIANAPEFEL